MSADECPGLFFFNDMYAHTFDQQVRVYLPKWLSTTTGACRAWHHVSHPTGVGRAWHHRSLTAKRPCRPPDRLACLGIEQISKLLILSNAKARRRGHGCVPIDTWRCQPSPSEAVGRRLQHNLLRLHPHRCRLSIRSSDSDIEVQNSQRGVFRNWRIQLGFAIGAQIMLPRR